MRVSSKTSLRRLRQTDRPISVLGLLKSEPIVSPIRLRFRIAKRRAAGAMGWRSRRCTSEPTTWPSRTVTGRWPRRSRHDAGVSSRHFPRFWPSGAVAGCCCYEWYNVGSFHSSLPSQGTSWTAVGHQKFKTRALKYVARFIFSLPLQNVFYDQNFFQFLLKYYQIYQ